MSSCTVLTPSGRSASMLMRRQPPWPLSWTPIGGEVECSVHAEPQRGRRLVATDLDWTKGSGPEVRGKAIDLVLLVSNRRQVLPCLEGPGLAGL